MSQDSPEELTVVGEVDFEALGLQYVLQLIMENISVFFFV